MRKISPEDVTWLNEDEAAKMFNYRRPKTIRENVQHKNWPITYRATNGRRFQYSKEDIQKYQLETSTAA